MMATEALSSRLRERDSWHCLKHDKLISVYATPAHSIIKEFSLPTTLKRIGFQRKCRRLHRFFDATEGQGLAVATMLDAGIVDGRGYVIYRRATGLDLRQVRWDMFPADAVSRIGEAIGAELQRLHASGWVHGDFKFGNVILDRGNDAAARLSIIDLEALRMAGWLPRRRRARDVARFLLNGLESDAPLELLVAFWHGYGDGKIAAPTRRWLQRLGARHQRQGRPIVDLNRLGFLGE